MKTIKSVNKIYIRCMNHNFQFSDHLYKNFGGTTYIKPKDLTGWYKEINGKIYVEVIYTRFFWKKFTVWVGEDHFYFETTSEEKIYNCREK